MKRTLSTFAIFLLGFIAIQSANAVDCLHGYTVGLTPSVANECSCIAGCALCTIGSGTCASCYFGWYMDMAYLCHEARDCQDGAYWDISLLSCEACDDSCVNCHGGTATECISCFPGETFTADSSGITGTCTCSSTECTNSCGGTPNLKKEDGTCDTIVDDTADGQYWHDADSTYYSCDASCPQCDGPGANDCTTCDTYAPLLDGTCLCHSGGCTDSDCPAGFFLYGPACEIIPDCPISMYFNTDDRECQACDSSCLECYGPDSDQCLDCTSPAILGSNDECMDLTGTFGSFDTDYKLFAELYYTNTNTEYLLVFNMDIEDYYDFLIYFFDVSIISNGEITKKNFNYSLSLEYTDAILITLDFQRTIYSSDSLYVNFSSLLSDYMDPLESDIDMIEYFKYSAAEKKAIASAASANEVGTVGGQVLTGVVSIAFQSPFAVKSQNMQGIMNTYQYINIDYPPNYSEYAKSSSGSSSSSSSSSSSPKSKSRLLKAESFLKSHHRMLNSNSPSSISVDKYLQNQHFEHNFKRVLINIVAAIGAILILDLITFIFKRKKISEEKWYSKGLKKGSISLRWSYLLSVYISNYQDLALYAFIETFNVIYPERKRNASLAIAVLAVIFTSLGVFALLGVILYTYREIKKWKKSGKKEEDMPDILLRLNIVHKDFQKTHLIKLFYPFLLMLRSLGYMIFIIFVYKSPLTSMIWMVVMSAIIVLYLVAVRPMDSIKDNIMTVIQEIVLLISVAATLGLHNINQHEPTNTEKRTKVAFMIIACNMAMSILNFIGYGFIGLEAALKGIKTIQERRKRKVQVVPKLIAQEDFNSDASPDALSMAKKDGVMGQHLHMVDAEENTPVMNSPEGIMKMNSRKGSSNERDGLLLGKNSSEVTNFNDVGSDAGTPTALLMRADDRVPGKNDVRKSTFVTPNNA